MRRKLPRAPITAHVSRRMARLPAGGATGVVCAVAGVACSVGLFVVRPAIVLPPSLDGRDRSPQPAARAIHVAAPRLDAPAGDGAAANTASGPSRGGSFPATRPG